jgi:D-alanyl-D-alanine carboxypeptidase (penicillin-binding protein 5/6)
MEPNSELFSLDNRKLINLMLLLVLALLLFVLVSLSISRGSLFHDQKPYAKVDPLQNISILARSAIVYDIGSKKVIYSKNPDDVLPLASLTKLLTMVTAVELLPPSTVVIIKKEFIAEEGDSGLLLGERWKLSDLIDYSLMVSSNDGASAIAAAAGAFQTQSDPSALTLNDFITFMNTEAKKIGMNNSHFFNVSGLDISKEQSGGYGSARDMATLFAYTLENHPDILSATRYQNLSFTSQSKIRHNAQNTDTALVNIPAVLGSKTGYTELAGGNLAVTFDPGIGRPITIVVLGSTIDGRFSDMETLVKKTFEYIRTENQTR